MAKKNAHNKMINCIKPYEAFHNKILIFSSGEGKIIIKYLKFKLNYFKKITNYK